MENESSITAAKSPPFITENFSGSTSMGFAIKKVTDALDKIYVIESVESSIDIVSITPSIVTEMEPMDEILSIYLYNTTRNEYNKIDMTYFLEVYIPEGIQIKLDLTRRVVKSLKSNNTQEAIEKRALQTKNMILKRHTARQAASNSQTQSQANTNLVSNANIALKSVNIDEAATASTTTESTKSDLSDEKTTTYPSTSTSTDTSNEKGGWSELSKGGTVSELEAMNMLLECSVPKAQYKELEQKFEVMKAQFEESRKRLREQELINQKNAANVKAKVKASEALLDCQSRLFEAEDQLKYYKTHFDATVPRDIHDQLQTHCTELETCCQSLQEELVNMEGKVDSQAVTIDQLTVMNEQLEHAVAAMKGKYNNVMVNVKHSSETAVNEISRIANETETRCIELEKQLKATKEALEVANDDVVRLRTINKYLRDQEQEREPFQEFNNETDLPIEYEVDRKGKIRRVKRSMSVQDIDVDKILEEMSTLKERNNYVENQYATDRQIIEHLSVEIKQIQAEYMERNKLLEQKEKELSTRATKINYEIEEKTKTQDSRVKLLEEQNKELSMELNEQIKMCEQQEKIWEREMKHISNKLEENSRLFEAKESRWTEERNHYEERCYQLQLLLDNISDEMVNLRTYVSQSQNNSNHIMTTASTRSDYSTAFSIGNSMSNFVVNTVIDTVTRSVADEGFGVFKKDDKKTNNQTNSLFGNASNLPIISSAGVYPVDTPTPSPPSLQASDVVPVSVAGDGEDPITQETLTSSNVLITDTASVVDKSAYAAENLEWDISIITQSPEAAPRSPSPAPTAPALSSPQTPLPDESGAAIGASGAIQPPMMSPIRDVASLDVKEDLTVLQAKLAGSMDQMKRTQEEHQTAMRSTTQALFKEQRLAEERLQTINRLTGEVEDARRQMLEAMEALDSTRYAHESILKSTSEVLISESNRANEVTQTLHVVYDELTLTKQQLQDVTEELQRTKEGHNTIMLSTTDTLLLERKVHEDTIQKLSFELGEERARVQAQNRRIEDLSLKNRELKSNLDQIYEYQRELSVYEDELQKTKLELAHQLQLTQDTDVKLKELQLDYNHLHGLYEESIEQMNGLQTTLKTQEDGFIRRVNELNHLQQSQQERLEMMAEVAREAQKKRGEAEGVVANLQEDIIALKRKLSDLGEDLSIQSKRNSFSNESSYQSSGHAGLGLGIGPNNRSMESVIQPAVEDVFDKMKERNRQLEVQLADLRQQNMNLNEQLSALRKQEAEVTSTNKQLSSITYILTERFETAVKAREITGGEIIQQLGDLRIQLSEEIHEKEEMKHGYEMRLEQNRQAFVKLDEMLVNSEEKRQELELKLLELFKEKEALEQMISARDAPATANQSALQTDTSVPGLSEGTRKGFSGNDDSSLELLGRGVHDGITRDTASNTSSSVQFGGTSSTAITSMTVRAQSLLEGNRTLQEKLSQNERQIEEMRVTIDQLVKDKQDILRISEEKIINLSSAIAQMDKMLSKSEDLLKKETIARQGAEAQVSVLLKQLEQEKEMWEMRLKRILWEMEGGPDREQEEMIESLGNISAPIKHDLYDEDIDQLAYSTSGQMMQLQYHMGGKIDGIGSSSSNRELNMRQNIDASSSMSTILSKSVSAESGSRSSTSHLNDDRVIAWEGDSAGYAFDKYDGGPIITGNSPRVSRKPLQGVPSRSLKNGLGEPVVSADGLDVRTLLSRAVGHWGDDELPEEKESNTLFFS